jgi:3-deoxy-manno-octulosonate cytidylyltransferase (CMP-KDO synthetase)
VAKSRYVSDVIVATDSEKIIEVVKKFGGRAQITSSNHPSGTDRIAEVARKLNSEIILNVQGDEPFIDTEVIDTVLKLMLKDQTINMASAKTNMTDIADFFNPAVVKVICDKNDRAIYFSRAPIPYFRDEFQQYKKNGKLEKQTIQKICSVTYKHIGIYGYRWDFLMRFTKMKEGFLEQVEKLEQLRAIENGIIIKVPTVKYNGFGIDTPLDLEKARKILKG